MITLILTLGTNLFTNIWKNALERYGDTQVHAMVLCLAVLASCMLTLFNVYPSAGAQAKEIVLETMKIFTGAVTLYNIFFKQIGKVVSLPVSS